MMRFIKGILNFKPAIFCLTIFFIALGIASYLTLPRENAPDITIPYVFVSTRYEGVSPQDIEKLITVHLEKKFRGLDKVKEIRSESIEGSSNITIEFYPDQDLDDAVQKVKDKIDLARQDLPKDIEEPIVSEINLSTDIPVISIAFFGIDSPNVLKKIVEDIKDKVESVPGVLEAKIFGEFEREIRIEIDVDRLNAYGIPIYRVLDVISKENKTSSAGNIEILAGKFQIRVPGEFINPSDINNLVITEGKNGPIYLTDIAEVKDTFKDRQSISRIQGKPCISLMVQKRSGQNVIKVTDGVKKVLAEERERFPEGVDYLITSDLSKDTYRMLNELENNIISGLILVLAILFLVLGLRNSFFVAFAIPMSMLITFTMLQILGITLNMIVLFSLILVLGMLVDNAIVLVENSFRYKNMGRDSFEAALLGASEVAVPIMGSTATTVVAFIPLLFWPDVIGKFMWYLPITLIIALLSSLFVALTINPVICSVGIKERPQRLSKITKFLDELGNRLLSGYTFLLEKTLDYPKTIFLFTLLIFIFVLYVFMKFGAGIELFPEVEPRRATITIEFPEGTRIDTTDATAAEIEQRIAKFPDIEYYLTTVGSGGGSYFKGGKSGTNLASILLEFTQFEKRSIPSSILVEAIRLALTGFSGVSIEKTNDDDLIFCGSPRQIQSLKLAIAKTLEVDLSNLKNREVISNNFSLMIPEKQFDNFVQLIKTKCYPFAGAEITINKEKEGPPSGAAIKIEVSGDDYQILGEISKQIQNKIADVKGLTDLKDDLVEGLPEIKFITDRQRLSIFELDTTTVATFIRAAINGLEISKYREGEDEYDITIRLPEHQRQDTNALLRMRIPNSRGVSVPLSNLGQFSYGEGYGTIKRKNQQRTITIEAEPAPGYSADQVLKEISKRLINFKLPAGYRINFAGEYEDQIENFRFLLKAFFIASGMIFIILVVQFNSILFPIIIFSSVLFSMIGVFSGLLIFNMRFSIIMTGLGIISLAGIVVNNAIVLIDFAIQQKRKGLNARSAALEAGKLRIRPVLLTAVTTILGLIPMAVGWSLEIHSFPPTFIAGAESSQWWAPMAIVVITGLFISTLLTLFLAPALYYSFDKIREKIIVTR